MFVSNTAVHHAARFHATVSHQVASQMNMHQLLMRGAHLRLVDRLIGPLPETLRAQLGLPTTALEVWISAETRGHILQGRRGCNALDVEASAHRIGEALQNILHVMTPRTHRDVIEVVAYVGSVGRHSVVALKFVPASRARSERDECWIQTSYPVGKNTLKRWENQGRLVPLDGSVGPSAP